MHRPLLTAIAFLGLTVSAQAARFDLARWLDEPDVKLVAVEVYSDYCEPCKAAAPRWEKLRKRYKDDGLKLVVINVDDYDSDRQCKTLPWRPDLLICSPEAGETLGVCERGRCSVPQAFLWSWQGNLLVSGQSHVDEVERAIRRYLGDHPRVQILATGVTQQPDRALRRLVASALGRTGKLTVVADREMKKRLAKVVKESHRPEARDDQRCQVGAEVSANSLLTVERFEGGTLSMTLADAATGCQRAAASATVGKRGLKQAVERATYDLMVQLKQRDIQMPRSKRRAGPSQVAVRAVPGERDGWRPDGGGEIAIAFTSTPPGARVTLDGELLCDATPCTKAVMPGRHRVAMTLARYAVRERSVFLEDGQDVSWRLQPTFGTLTVTSQPSGVMVTIDGKELGRTPLSDVALAEGEHTVVVGDRCHRPATREVTLPRGKSHTLDVPLEARPAGLKVSAVDARGNALKADVLLDGATLGRTPGTFKVPVCAERLEVRQRGGERWRQRLALREKQTTEVTATLGGERGGDAPKPGSFVRIAPGTFTRGSPESESGRQPDEGPTHRVTVSRAFALQATEVTQGQWKALMGTTPATFSSCGADCPVETVSWWDAVAYTNALSKREGLPACYRLSGCSGRPGDGRHTCSGVSVAARGGDPAACAGYRLPTEAEWELAARAGTTGARYGKLSRVAWTGKNAGSKTHPVGQKQANAWGLYDMLGNVWEWTWDWKGPYTGASVRDPHGASTRTNRVTRGCGWQDEPYHCRAAFRHEGVAPPSVAFASLGFRVARTLDVKRVPAPVAAPSKPPRNARASAPPPPEDDADAPPSAAEKADDDPTVKALLVHGFGKQVVGDTTKAIALYQSAANKGSAKAWRAMGNLYNIMGKKKKAIAAWKNYLRLRPDAWDAGIIRHTILWSGGVL